MNMNRYIYSTSAFNFVEQTRKWDSVINSLYKFKSLEDNWDGEGSHAPNRESIDMLIDFFGYVRPFNEAPSRVLVAHGGEVIVEWQYHDYILELETSFPGILDFMVTPDEGEPTFYEVKSPFQRSNYFMSTFETDDIGMLTTTGIGTVTYPTEEDAEYALANLVNPVFFQKRNHEILDDGTTNWAAT